ncbi:hypothetical protein CS542_07340 [Pedobacter sp. IW39]|nr:hypothetical protein CS542_07340 [Pedobacter sp. IW39]
MSIKVEKEVVVVPVKWYAGSSGGRCSHYEWPLPGVTTGDLISVKTGTDAEGRYFMSVARIKAELQLYRRINRKC